jgi:hypothetical protein
MVQQRCDDLYKNRAQTDSDILYYSRTTDKSGVDKNMS